VSAFVVSSSGLKDLELSALLLRKTDYGESDLVLNVFTDGLGRIAVMARAARSSKRRFAGGIEPFHGLRLCMDAPLHGELYRLRNTRIEVARLGLASNLVALNIAGRALTWVRRTTVPHTPEPQIFVASCRLLDALDHQPPETTTAGEARLAEFGLVLLTALGWALELERCVRCGRPCPEPSPATVDPRHGGLVCRRCGGARQLIDAALRHRMVAAQRGEHSDLLPTDAGTVLDVVEATLLVHPGIESA
jgi:DNA repair protein RecO (recombination protein O)